MPRLAMAYMGYQFGVLNKGLGDGRAFVWGQWRCSRHLNPAVPSSSCSLPSSASSNGLASDLDTLRSGGGGEDLTSINPSAGQYSSGEADEEEEEADEEEAEEAEAGELWEMGTKGSGKTPFSRGHDGLLTREGAVREVQKREKNTSFAMPFNEMLKMINLPRQARDKHREITQNETRAVFRRRSHRR